MGATRRFGAIAAAVLLLALALAPGGGARPPAHASTGSQIIFDPADHVYWAANADLAANPRYRFRVSGIRSDGAMTYKAATVWVSRLNAHDYLGHNNWQLPVTPTPYSDSGCTGYNKSGGGFFGLKCTEAPLAYLYRYWLGLRWPAPAVPITVDHTTGPFQDFQPYLYWSGTVVLNKKGKPTPGYDTVSFNTGWIGQNQYDHYMYALPVLPGNPFGGTARTGLESVDNGQAVYEPATKATPSVTWLADADLAKTQPLSVKPAKDGALDEHSASTWAGELSTAQWQGETGWLGVHGWALPTEHELIALYKALTRAGFVTSDQPVVPVPNTTQSGFHDIQPYLYWSCAGPNVESACQGKPNKHPQQWSFSFGNGYLGTDLDKNHLYVMVYYRSSQPSPIGRCPPHQPGGPITCN